MNATSLPCILVVEDEPRLAKLLAVYLRDSGMTPVIVHDGLAALEAFAQHRPALVLLDLNLPGRDGVSVCRDLRAASTVPIVMMTARIDEIDRLIGLEAGADDYICKPYSPREVMARVKAQLRRVQWAQDGVPRNMPATSGPDGTGARVLDINITNWRVHLDGEPVDLTPTEVRLLHTLHAAPGRVFSRQQLLDHLHDDGRAVTDRVIDSHVRNLRRKLATVTQGIDPIRSVYGVGYSFEWPAAD
ncbi:MAG: response regulator [Candidatus Accumulibacter meliphilus]|jgi:two-component system response regulator BaeR|uniref:response regulator n=1 Tax=Candidatus Accumulibacter meliphilus TaxID=2211374 RepID=UPI002FC309A1